MPRKATAADSDNTVKEELPTCSGAHFEFAQWFRDLLQYSYLFEADVAFFLATQRQPRHKQWQDSCAQH